MTFTELGPSLAVDDPLPQALAWAHRTAATMALRDLERSSWTDRAILGSVFHTHLVQCTNMVLAAGGGASDSSGSRSAAGGFPVTDQSLPPAVGILAFRDDLHGSPSWVCGTRRLLLCSGPLDDLWQFDWGRLRRTKRELARNVHAMGQLALRFEAAELSDPPHHEVIFSARGIDPAAQRYRALIGSPAYPHPANGSSWRWAIDITMDVVTAGPVVHLDVEDAPVLLRREGIAGAHLDAG